MSARQLRAGITGYGLAGRYFHAPFLRAAGFEVIGATTSNPERIAHLKEDFPNAIAYSDVADLLAQDLDLLVVASANVAHASDAIAGLRAGVAVVVATNPAMRGWSRTDRRAIEPPSRPQGHRETTRHRLLNPRE